MNLFRPQFLVTFQRVDGDGPTARSEGPQGPTYMPQYKQPEQAQATALDN